MTPDGYVRRCREPVVSVAASLPSDEVGWAMHLIDRGEPAEGLASLAWSIESACGAVPFELASRIVESIDGLVPTNSLPPSVQAAARREGSAPRESE